ncbi:MAG: hypothetical protein ACOZAA_08825 [Pseudomonadota bacterium]
MTFENLDKVTAFERLRDALQVGANSFRVAMHCYFWGRLSSFAITAGSVGAETDAGLKSMAVGVLQGDHKAQIERISADAEATALAVKEAPPKKLMSVAYWSNICYLFRYLASSDPKWCAFSADSFLSALDDLDALVRPSPLRCEMKNLTHAFSVAEAISDAKLPDDAEGVFRWSSSSPIGELLPDFVRARLK